MNSAPRNCSRRWPTISRPCPVCMKWRAARPPTPWRAWRRWAAKACSWAKYRTTGWGGLSRSPWKRLGSIFTMAAATATSMIAVTPDGQRSMNTFLGACREMTPDDVDEDRISRARVLYIEGYLWDEEKAKQASRKAIAAVKGAGGRIALTLSDPFCVGRFRDEFLHLLDRDVGILFANEEEA